MAIDPNLPVATVFSMLDIRISNAEAGNGSQPITAPSITTPAAISSDGTPQVGELLTGVDPVVLRGSVTSRAWLLGGTTLATTPTFTPTQTGVHTFRATVTGIDGSTLVSSSTLTVAAATVTPTPTPGPTPTPTAMMLDGVSQAPVMRAAGSRTATTGQTGPIASVAVGTGTPFDVASAAEATAGGATKVVGLYSGSDLLTFSTRLDLVVENDRIISANNGSSEVLAAYPSSILTALNGATGLHGFVAMGGVKAATSGSDILQFLSSDVSGTVPIFQMSRNTSQVLQFAYRRLSADGSTLITSGGIPSIVSPSFEIFDAGIDYNTAGTRMARTGRGGTFGRNVATANTDANTIAGTPLVGNVRVPPGGRLHAALFFKGALSDADTAKLRSNAQAQFRPYLQQNDGNATWWGDNAAAHPDLTTVVVGTTNGDGLFQINEFDAVTRKLLSTRTLEDRLFDQDEHNEVVVAFTPAGRLLVAIIGHSNQVGTRTTDVMGRVRVFISTTGKIADININAGVNYVSANVTTTAGLNYGLWDIIDENTWVLTTNNDNRADWREIRWTDGNIANGVKLRPIFGGTIQTGGQAQTYALKAKQAALKRKFAVQFHPSNVRNIIYGIDVDYANGAVTSKNGAVVYGNVFTDGTEANLPLVDFSSGTVVLPEVLYDPGAGNSFRLMDISDTAITGVVFVASDGSNARHITVPFATGVAIDLGAAGAYFGSVFPGAYYPSIVRAKEPHSGFRFYRAFNDGSVTGAWTLERLDMTTLGGPITRTPIASTAAGTDKLLRPFAIKGATEGFAGWIAMGAYGGFQSWRTRVVPFSSTGF